MPEQEIRVRPDPDPTVATHQLVDVKVSALDKEIKTRLDAMDQAMQLFQDNITRVPTDTDKQIKQLRDLIYETFKTHDERFVAVNIRFQERDIRFSQASKSNEEAVNAAFSAAKEAVAEQNRSASLSVAKAENNMKEQMDQLKTLTSNSFSAIEDKISDVKERITVIESKAGGHAENRSDARAGRSEWIGILGFGLFAATALISVVVFMNKPAERVFVERATSGATP